jgi:hypothetical protein
VEDSAAGVSQPHANILQQILSGVADANIPFADLCHLLLTPGFEIRTKGRHHVFWEKVYEGIYEMDFNKDGQDIQDLYH